MSTQLLLLRQNAGFCLEWTRPLGSRICNSTRTLLKNREYKTFPPLSISVAVGSCFSLIILKRNIGWLSFFGPKLTTPLSNLWSPRHIYLYIKYEVYFCKLRRKPSILNDYFRRSEKKCATSHDPASPSLICPPTNHPIFSPSPNGRFKLHCSWGNKYKKYNRAVPKYRYRQVSAFFWWYRYWQNVADTLPILFKIN